ncbi:uncharacterized protein N7496_006088 [Penicillium cataractarum]|uniref:Uncharacterized protein n=1 Tax=Penicillium cataractarum TaxID=2100454 RepID=A0A9W9S131_9EURO|nr:uncharacterized protein N7496_006088 [Penicillium cataractarum]KAJ5369996.1 hypothetical protein N7496_006088 [Penicillium cataractarum]
MPSRHGRENRDHGELHEADYEQWAREQYGTRNAGSETQQDMGKMNAIDLPDLCGNLAHNVRPSIVPTSVYPSIQSQLPLEKQVTMLFFVLGFLLIVLAVLYALKDKKEKPDDIIA